MHKSRRWWQNIKVKKKGPSRRVAVIASFINLQKLLYLLALSSHCPHYKHLEWLKLIRVQLWSIWLTNHKLKTSCPVKYKYPNLMLLCLGPKQVIVIVSIHVSSRTANGVPPCPMTWNEPTSKWQDKQTMNTSTSLLFTICIVFYFEMRRRMFTMDMLQISTINYAWLRLAAQAFLQHIYKLHELHNIPIYFTPRVSINKRSRYQLKIR
jgi:hypothetical protein